MRYSIKYGPSEIGKAIDLSYEDTGFGSLEKSRRALGIVSCRIEDNVEQQNSKDQPVT